MEFADPAAARRWLVYTDPEAWTQAGAVLWSLLALWVIWLIVLKLYLPGRTLPPLAAAGLATYCFLFGFAVPYWALPGEAALPCSLSIVALLGHTAWRLRRDLRCRPMEVVTLTTLAPFLTFGAWLAYFAFRDFFG